jgi:hypothetical protein
MRAQDQVFRMSRADTLGPSVDTLAIHPSVSILLHELTMCDTAASSDELEYYQVFTFSVFGARTPFQTIVDSGHSAHEYEVIDLNGDGYKDFKINEDWYNLIAPSTVWLFNPKTSRFEYSEALSGESELDVDENNVYSSTDQSTGGKGGYSEKFVLENGEKKVIESVYTDLFDYEKRELVNNKLILVAQDSMVGFNYDSTFGVISRKLVFDSLRVVAEKKIAATLGKRDLRGFDPEAIFDEAFGQFILLGETSWKYKPGGNGKLQVIRTVRRLVGKKLVTVSSAPIR